MKHAPVHLPKSVLSERARGRLPASDFVFPAERRYPINDLYHGRLALIYVMSPSNAADRDTVVKAVLARYPELRSFWESRFSAKRRATSSRVQRGKVVRPSRPARPATVPARGRERRLSTNPSEEAMPIYVVNPLAYDQTDVIMVGKPRRRLIKARTPGKPGRRSERLTLPSSETHALNPKTGAAFCGAGEGHCVVVTPNGPQRMRTGKPAKGMIHKADKNLVTCYRCIKILQMNYKDWRSFPLGLAGKPEMRAFTERNLKPGKEGKREKHLMIKGGEQGRWISGFTGMTADNKQYRIYRQRNAETGGSMYRGTEDIKDFEKYVGWRGKPTQTIGEKRSAILAGRRAAEEAARTAEAARSVRPTPAMLSGMTPAYIPEGFSTGFGGYEEEEVGMSAAEARRAEMARRGRMGAAAAAKRRAETVAAEEVRGAEAVRRMMGPPEAYVGNPRRGRKSTRSQKAGLAKGQSLMQQAAAAYRAGKYDSMQEALRGVARGGRRKNPTLLEESMVSNPRRKGAKRGSKKSRSAQGNAARAMSLFRSGEADSLSEAWAMVKRGA